MSYANYAKSIIENLSIIDLMKKHDLKGCVEEEVVQLPHFRIDPSWIEISVDGQKAGAYRSRQTTIWDYFNDVNKLSEEWWLSHIKHYSRRFSKYKCTLSVAESYLASLEYWVNRGMRANYFTDTVELAFKGAIKSVH